jgi:hypothetical protein
MDKKRILIIGMIILTILIIIGLSYFAIQCFSGTKMKSNNAGAWKNYKNDEYDFELKYPAELAGKEKIEISNDGSESGIAFMLFGSADPNDPQDEFMKFAADKLTRSLATKPLIKDACRIPGASDMPPGGRVTEKDVSGLKMTRAEFEQKNKNSIQGNTITRYIGYIGKVKDVCYRFNFYYSKRNDLGKQDDIDLFEKIISNIVFNNPRATQNAASK